MAKVRIIPDETIISIWKDIQNGLSNAVICKKHNISRATLHRIKNKEKRYGEIIDNFLRKSENESSKSSEEVSHKKLLSQNEEKIILENFNELNYETFVSILYQSFSRYYQPIILKLIYDNFLSTEESKKLIKRTIRDIQETKSIENLFEALNTIQAVIHTQLLTPETLEKILKE
jgi:hypothetical protein